MARPTKYNATIQRKADKYVKSYNLYVKKSKQVVTKTGDIIEIEEDVPNDLPSLVGLALHLGVHRETLYNWGNANPKFFDTLEVLKQKQKQFLLHHGLNRNYDSSFAKFVAINMTDMKEKVETESEIDVTVNVTNHNKK